MDTVTYIFVSAYRILVDVFSIQFTVAGYTVSVGSVTIFIIGFVILGKFLYRLSE